MRCPETGDPNVCRCKQKQRMKNIALWSLLIIFCLIVIAIFVLRGGKTKAKGKLKSK
jgi:hypothetical protein